ncbi:uncharacterized protein LOC105689153 [Athalia rosae]|uniref:uncharacterized protein LOC105689153 n=1 Tax=Athalia rosae TaxID=37344 RepID=UPI00203388AB|nr:uncharacterized protein LOC105689153 [Athalia rosae]
MDEEIDIYADLPSFNEDNENHAEKNKILSENCVELEKKVDDLTQSLEAVKKTNHNLEVNLSSLLQTAKAEIARKDRMIADLRKELEDIRFRRGSNNRPAHRSPPRKKREEIFKSKDNSVQIPKVPDLTEFVCDPPVSDDDDDDTTNKSQQINALASTVFGQRLHKRILKEQEAEKMQSLRSKDIGEQDLRKQNIEPSVSRLVDENVEVSSKDSSQPHSPRLDNKGSNVTRTKHKDSSLDSEHSSHSQEINSHTRWKTSTVDDRRDRKRPLVDNSDTKNYKRFKTNDRESRHRDRISHVDRSDRSSSRKGNRNKSRDRHINEFVADNTKSKGGSATTTVENEHEDGHNRVALRLLLLAEGIDPDLDENNSVKHEKRAFSDKGEDARANGKKFNNTRSRSRSTEHNIRNEKNKRYNRSRSRTPEKFYKSKNRDRRNDNSYRKTSRDRFDRRKDQKNKDGDNLSEFSQEIHELKEKIEHSDRVEKSKNLNAHKKINDRTHHNARSKTPDNNKRNSEEKITRASSKDEKSSRKSKSREKKHSRERNRRPDHDETRVPSAAQTSQPVVRAIKNIGGEEILPPEDIAESSNVPETKSLVSLEDGEIVDSVTSSPVKSINSIANDSKEMLPRVSKLHLSDPKQMIPQEKCSHPLREIGNNQIYEQPVVSGETVLTIPESNRPAGPSEALNISKEERIENIAEFIANFTQKGNENSSQSRKKDQPDDEISRNNSMDMKQSETVSSATKDCNKKMQITNNTVLQGSSKDDSPIIPYEKNDDNISNMNQNEKANRTDNDWCLIAIDSPVKNFEENRKTRLKFQETQIAKNGELENIVAFDKPAPENSKDDSKISSTVDSSKKPEPVDAKVTPIKTAKGKIKGPGIKSFKSTYSKFGKEIVLSDANSEQCTRIASSVSAKPTIKCLDDAETEVQGKDGSKKVEGPSGKVKKDQQKVIVSGRRRKPVLLEDSTSASSVAISPNSSTDSVVDFPVNIVANKNPSPNNCDG